MQQFHTPHEAAQWLRGLVQGALQSDSRQVRQGDGFLAWVGQSSDARQHVLQAWQQGAAACLVEAEGIEAFEAVNDLALHDAPMACMAQLKAQAGLIADAYHESPSRQLKMLAVTGTNGKTSTAWWLTQALNKLGEPCTLVGTLGMGQPGEMHSTGLTTPHPLQLQQQLRHWVHDGVQACAIEASSIGLAEHRLDGVRFRTAIFTNFTQDHLDYHGDMAHYWAAKQRLFDWPDLKAAVVNLDDPVAALLMAHLKLRPEVKVWTVSMQAPADVMAQQVQTVADGVQFNVVEAGHSVPMRSQALGDFNVLNVLGVIAALRDLGFSLQQAVDACHDLEAVPGRMQRVGQAHQPAVVVDYAHTPDAVDKALQALRPWAHARGGRVMCILGCGGNRDTSKRAPMARMAEHGADLVCLTSDNPRHEDPLHILAQMRQGLKHPEEAMQLVDRAQAIAQVIALAQAQDVVLIAGKGHETYQDIQGVMHGFSDVDHAELALHKWGHA
jgi:UDP-N-acetylmuramoyl-L-alanyl-D-glutamate--2,6-diaminopimelate ligase